MVSIINVGLVGIGTIGSGVVKILQNNSELIEKRTGIRINLKKVCGLKSEKAKKLGVEDKFTANYEDLISDKDINVIIELVGNYEPARTIISKALNNRKHVVTANKAVIAKYGYELFEAARKNSVGLCFEAAVGGCIPIIRTLQQSYAAENIKSIYGILNGTTNYILTRMQEGVSYGDALKKAQELGFAEPDPSFDINGLDAAQKLAILSSLAFNCRIDNDVYTEGITELSKFDLEYANELGYNIKLLAITKKVNDEIELRVHPTMIPKSHELCSVSNEFNAIYISGENTTNSMLYGKGAGQLPTATVVLGDIIGIANKNVIAPNYFSNAKIKDINSIKSRYYLRCMVIDKPGVLAKIARILGDNNISISGVQQKEFNKEIVPIILLTHEAIEKNIKKAISEIDKLDVTKKKTVIIRIEDL